MTLATPSMKAVDPHNKKKMEKWEYFYNLSKIFKLMQFILIIVLSEHLRNTKECYEKFFCQSFKGLGGFACVLLRILQNFQPIPIMNLYRSS